MPGLNGFVGEFMILDRLVPRPPAGGSVVAGTGVILAALYLLWAYQRVFHGEPDDDNRTFRELKVREGMVLLPFIAAIVFMGVFPKPVIDRIEPSVDKLLAHITEVTGYTEPTPQHAESGEDTGHESGDTTEGEEG